MVLNMCRPLPCLALIWVCRRFWPLRHCPGEPLKPLSEESRIESFMLGSYSISRLKRRSLASRSRASSSTVFWSKSARVMDFSKWETGSLVRAERSWEASKISPIILSNLACSLVWRALAMIFESWLGLSRSCLWIFSFSGSSSVLGPTIRIFVGFWEIKLNTNR